MRIVLDTNILVSAALKQKSTPGVTALVVVDLIVSGDADLLALNPFQGIPIITAAAFVQSAGR
jgi:predicted nucleic acid-binding protein